MAFETIGLSAENREVVYSTTVDDLGFGNLAVHNKIAFIVSDFCVLHGRMLDGSHSWELDLGNTFSRNTGQAKPYVRYGCIDVNPQCTLLAVAVEFRGDTVLAKGSVALVRLGDAADGYEPKAEPILIPNSYIPWDNRVGLCFFNHQGDKLVLFSVYQRGIFFVDCVHPFGLQIIQYEGNWFAEGVAAVDSGIIIACSNDICPLKYLSFADNKLFNLPVQYDPDLYGVEVQDIAYDPIAQRIWIQHKSNWFEHQSKDLLSCVDLNALDPSNPMTVQFIEGTEGIGYSSMHFSAAGAGRIKGTVTDVNGQPAARTVEVFSRGDARLLGRTQSNASDGRYELTIPYRDPCDVVFRALPGEGLPDLVRPCGHPLKAIWKEPFDAWPEGMEEIAGVEIPPYPIPVPPPKPKYTRRRSSVAYPNGTAYPPAPAPSPNNSFGMVDGDWVWTEYGYQHTWVVPGYRLPGYWAGMTITVTRT